MTELLFFIAAIGAIAGAIGVVTLRNPFFSVLALVFHLLSLAALFLLLQAQFVAAAQVVVYAGAVMVLYVFVVAYVGAAEAAHFKAPVGGGQRTLAVGFALALFVELAIAVLGSGLDAIGTDGPRVPFGFGGPEQIGQALLTKFLVAFEVASYLLLIAAVGAVVLARRRGGIHDEAEVRVPAFAFELPPGTATMAEAVEGRTGTQAHRPLGPPAGTGEPRDAAAVGTGDGSAAGAPGERGAEAGAVSSRGREDRP
jgi:NADH:ubiquinone oxidoreductase subunit 6 (subunit J)